MKLKLLLILTALFTFSVEAQQNLTTSREVQQALINKKKTCKRFFS